MSASIVWQRVMAIFEVAVRHHYDAPWRQTGAERLARSAPKYQS